MSMSCDQRLYLGVGGRRCGAFMSPIFRDQHPTCARCRGIKCTADITCDICKDWSVAQWEAFRRKRRPSGSALPPASQTPPPPASSSLEAGCSAPPPRSLPPPSEGRDRSRGGGVEGVFRVGEVPPPSSLSKGGEGRSTAGALASAGVGDSATSSLPGEGVAGSSRSQESLMLDDPVLVASSSSPGRDRRSRSRARGDSTGDCSRSHSSRLSPPRGRDAREGHRGACPQSRGYRALSWESRFHSTDRSRSRGRKRSRHDFTITFCLCVVSLLPVAVF